MKRGWENKSLGELCEIYQPKSISSKEMTDNGRYVVYGANGKIGRYDYYNHEEPQLLLTCRGATCGSVNISEPYSWITGNAMVVRPRNKDICIRFIEFYLRGAIDFSEVITGSAQPQITKQSLAPVTVSYPNLDEQKRIVAILDEAFEGLDRAHANAEANLKSARELFESELHNIFGNDVDDWIELKLSEVGTTQTGSTPKSSEAGMLGQFIPFVKPGDFKPNGELDYFNEGLSEKGASASRIVPAGSALMVCIGATIGKTGFNIVDIATNQQINSVTPRDGVDGEYLYYQMLLPRFQSAVMMKSGQATLPIINKSNWSALTVHLPKQLSRQHEIVEKLRELRAQSEELGLAYRSKKVAISNLRQSLLQKAFAGELT